MKTKKILILIAVILVIIGGCFAFKYYKGNKLSENNKNITNDIFKYKYPGNEDNTTEEERIKERVEQYLLYNAYHNEPDDSTLSDTLKKSCSFTLFENDNKRYIYGHSLCQYLYWNKEFNEYSIK